MQNLNEETEYRKESEELFKNMAEWRNNYNHKSPCQEYLETGFCKHVVKARTRKFEKRIMENLMTRLKLLL